MDKRKVGRPRTGLFKCCLCKEYKSKNDFSLDKNRDNGVSSRCNECKPEYNKKREKDRRVYHTQYDIKYPEKLKGRIMVRNALKNGDITKLPCQFCNSERSMGHHDDYSKPLEVRWLCQKHHSQYHLAQIRP